MGVSQQISAHEMNKVMKSAVKGVICTVIYGMDPAVMLPMISETGILTVGGHDPYSGELNKMIRRGTDDDSAVNHRLLDILFSRHKWWIVFIRVCQQCEYYDVIEAIEGKLTTTQKSELYRQIQCSTRQGNIEGRAERRDDQPLSHRPPGVQQNSCERSPFPKTMDTPTQRPGPPQGNVPGRGLFNEQIRSSQSSCDRKPERPQGLSLSDSRRQFEKRLSDSSTFDESSAMASTQTTDSTGLKDASTRTTDSTRGCIQLKGSQVDVEYQNTEMNSNIGRSPERLVDGEKKISITKDLIHYAPNTIGTDTNNLSIIAPYNFKKLKTAVDTASNIGWNILVPDKSAVGSDSDLTTRRESNMDKVGNILSLEELKIQNHPREDATDTSVVTDDATSTYTYPNFQHDGVNSHHDNGGRGEDNVLQDIAATGGSNIVPYVSGIIIQAQLDLQRKHHGGAQDQQRVVVEHDSPEKERLEDDPPEKVHHHDFGGRCHHPEETYCKECHRVKSQDTNTQPEVMNTETPVPDFPASAKTRADSDVPFVPGSDHMSENANLVGNVPNFGLLGCTSIETTIQSDDISPDWIEEEASQNAISDRLGDNTFPTEDNGTKSTLQIKVISETKRSSANTHTEISNALQQACSPLRETSGGSVYLSPHYSSRSGYPQVVDYTHIAPPAHVMSLSDTSEPPPVHEDLAETALNQETDGASPVKPR